jgi:PAS domain S-box-containing protein
MLVERDRLMADMRQIRSGQPRYMDELRRLLGDREVGARVAHLAETRLADTQRLLELLLRASASAIVVADLDSGVLYEANPAYCNFAGRSRSELLGSRAHPDDTWYRSSERRAFVDEMRQAGVMEGYTTAMQRPDGTVRIGRGTSYVISVASQTVVLAIIEDITDRYEGPDKDMTKLGPVMR